MTVIATGGLAPLVIDEVSVIDAHEPWLTLIGLRLVFERNNLSAWPGVPGVPGRAGHGVLGSDRPGTLQVGPVRLGEAEPLVQPVRVRGVQRPPERRAGPAVDHRGHQFHAQALAAELLVDVDVGQVGEPGPVRHGPGEADHRAGGAVW